MVFVASQASSELLDKHYPRGVSPQNLILHLLHLDLAVSHSGPLKGARAKKVGN